MMMNLVNVHLSVPLQEDSNLRGPEFDLTSFDKGSGRMTREAWRQWGGTHERAQC